MNENTNTPTEAELVSGLSGVESGKRYDVLDHNGDVLESWDARSLAQHKAKEHGFTVRDNGE